MKPNHYTLESKIPFSQSMLWQLNRNFYDFKGPTAWSDNLVPAHLTSNSKVGKAYAAIIFGLLKDLGLKGRTKDKVYILELGAGHGRLAFHTLVHLQRLVINSGLTLPPFCYVLSDFAQDNLFYFQQHPQLQEFFNQGQADVSFFDAESTEKLYLRLSKKTIETNDLEQPIICIANYFFDSIPNELFYVKNNTISSTTISIHSKDDPADQTKEPIIKELKFYYTNTALNKPFYDVKILDDILEEYRKALKDSYLFFPKKAINCIDKVGALSKQGLMLLSIDKGFHELHDLENHKAPDIVTHGNCFSLWVNFHALGNYCEKQGGKVIFPEYSTFHLELACLLFLKDGSTYKQTEVAYQNHVDDFGPDDFNSLKYVAYKNISKLELQDFIAFMRLGSYDSGLFIKLLPQFKSLSKRINFNERNRISQTMHRVWEMYFNINESLDLAYEMAGIFYDLGYYTDALDFFNYSVDHFGYKEDSYYNIVLCHYQLRQDKLFHSTLAEAKETYPAYHLFEELDKLDMS